MCAERPGGSGPGTVCAESPGGSGPGDAELCRRVMRCAGVCMAVAVVVVAVVAAVGCIAAEADAQLREGEEGR